MFGKTIASLTLLVLAFVPIAWAEDPIVPTQGVTNNDPAMSPQQAAQQQAGVSQVQQSMAAVAVAMTHIPSDPLVLLGPPIWGPPPGSKPIFPPRIDPPVKGPFPSLPPWPSPIDPQKSPPPYKGDVIIPDPNNPVV